MFVLNSMVSTGYAGASGAFWGVVIIMVHTHYIKKGPNALPKRLRTMALCILALWAVIMVWTMFSTVSEVAKP